MLVKVRGIEPLASWSQARRSADELHSVMVQTLRVELSTLCSSSRRSTDELGLLAPKEGLGPSTIRLTGERSTVELLRMVRGLRIALSSKVYETFEMLILQPQWRNPRVLPPTSGVLETLPYSGTDCWRLQRDSDP